MAACSRRLFLSSIWAKSRASMASAPLSEPESMPERMESAASKEPGILRSASMRRMRSLREGVGAFTVHLLLRRERRRPRAGGARP